MTSQLCQPRQHSLLQNGTKSSNWMKDLKWKLNPPKNNCFKFSRMPWSSFRKLNTSMKWNDSQQHLWHYFPQTVLFFERQNDAWNTRSEKSCEWISFNWFGKNESFGSEQKLAWLVFMRSWKPLFKGNWEWAMIDARDILSLIPKVHRSAGS